MLRHDQYRPIRSAPEAPRRHRADPYPAPYWRTTDTTRPTRIALQGLVHIASADRRMAAFMADHDAFRPDARDPRTQLAALDHLCGDAARLRRFLDDTGLEAAEVDAAQRTLGARVRHTGDDRRRCRHV